MKDAVATMGMVLPDDVSGRDAVHVAVISAVAAEELDPGEHVGVETRHEAGRDIVASAFDDPIGIVDPFLSAAVEAGDRFWLFLYPRTITGLRHVWEHPSFPEGEATARAEPEPEVIHHSRAKQRVSKQWLRDFCARADCPGYKTVLEAAEKVADGEVVGWDGEYLHFNGEDAHGTIPPEFWDHVEVVLGRRIKGKRAAHFSCAC